MSKITIENNAAPPWRSVIEHKASLVLSSLATSVFQIRIAFNKIAGDNSVASRYRCVVSAAIAGRVLHQAVSTHPDGDAAIEGAVLRFRRNVSRARQESLRGSVRSAIN